MQSKWTKQEILKLYDLKQNKGLSFPEVANELNKTYDSVRKKFKRTNWKKVLLRNDLKSKEVPIEDSKPQKWTSSETHQLYAYLQAEKSYSFIAEKLGRTHAAVERKAQTTQWDAWLKVESLEEATDNGDVDLDVFRSGLVDSLIVISRHSVDRLNSISEKEFLDQINLSKEDFNKSQVKFEDIKQDVERYLEGIGLTHPLSKELGEGTYLVVGDSHGRKTKNNMFKLIENVNKYLGAKNVIHVGHILDDDNNINYNLGQIQNLLIVTRKEELRIIQDEEKKQIEKNGSGFNFNMVRSHVKLGNDLVVENSDLITDYTKKPLKSLDQEIMEAKTIVNCHRQEFATKCTEEDENSYFASPGCICEKHVIKTIKQIDFKDISKNKVKVAYHDSFQKYRRMEKMYHFWKQGLLVVHVDREGSHTIVPCIIKKINDQEYATSYFDKIITSKGVFNPDKKIFVHADMHAPHHDSNILSIQEQICEAYSPDVFVNIGDAHDFSSLNHHEMDRGIAINDCVLEEGAKVHHILKEMSSWAKERYIIIGNHERFSEDFVKKFPQFKKYLDFNFICGVEGLGYQIVPLKKVLHIGPTKFIHGDLIMYNQTGSKMEKASRTFSKRGEGVFIGHIHQTGIRFNAYSVGFSGLLDQGYNEPSASSWNHGFGLCNHYKNVDFPTSIPIMDSQCIINNVKYLPKDIDKWEIKSFNAKIVYETQ